MTTNVYTFNDYISLHTLSPLLNESTPYLLPPRNINRKSHAHDAGGPSCGDFEVGRPV